VLPVSPSGARSSDRAKRERRLEEKPQTDAEQWKLPDPIVPGIGYDRQPPSNYQARHLIQLPDDLSIPDGLQR
jgi:hypothetical protein